MPSPVLMVIDCEGYVALVAATLGELPRWLVGWVFLHYRRWCIAAELSRLSDHLLDDAGI